MESQISYRRVHAPSSWTTGEYSAISHSANEAKLVFLNVGRRTGKIWFKIIFLGNRCGVSFMAIYNPKLWSVCSGMSKATVLNALSLRFSSLVILFIEWLCAKNLAQRHFLFYNNCSVPSKYGVLLNIHAFATPCLQYLESVDCIFFQSIVGNRPISYLQKSVAMSKYFSQDIRLIGLTC